MSEPQRYSIKFFRAKDEDGSFVMAEDYESANGKRIALYEALKTFWALFDGPAATSFVISPATKRLMTVGEQDRIDAAITKAQNAMDANREAPPWQMIRCRFSATTHSLM